MKWWQWGITVFVHLIVFTGIYVNLYNWLKIWLSNNLLWRLYTFYNVFYEYRKLCVNTQNICCYTIKFYVEKTLREENQPMISILISTHVVQLTLSWYNLLDKTNKGINKYNIRHTSFIVIIRRIFRYTLGFGCSSVKSSFYFHVCNCNDFKILVASNLIVRLILWTLVRFFISR